MGTFSYVGLAVLTERGRKAVKQAVTESAEHLAGEAQAAAPVDTGTLRASIGVSVSGRGSNASQATYTATVSTSGEANEYAVYQHQGTSRGVPATRFLEDPLIENRGVYLDAMRRAARAQF
jgi:hypothetical protein